MIKLAIIDIGSNSIRLLLVEIDSSGYYKVIDQLRESVRLGADMLEDKILNSRRIEKAIRTLCSFKNFCTLLRVDEILAVATEAVRKAENISDFLGRSKYEAGIDIRVLSGTEEAYYDSLAIKKSMYVNNSLVIDIGGASTELAWIRENIVIEYLSLPFGAVNLTQKFMSEGNVTCEIKMKILEFVNSSLSKIPWLKENEFDSIIGIGGTIKNLGKVHRKKFRYLLDSLYNYQIPYEDLHSIFNSVKDMKPAERQVLAGLSAERADIFTAPLLVLDYLMNKLNIPSLQISSYGLREGLLYEYVGKLNPIEDILEYSLRNLLACNSLDSECCFNFYLLADEFFRKFRPVHKLHSSTQIIIKVASILFAAGLNIIYYDYDDRCLKLSFNSEIYGLSQKQLLISVLSAYYGRNWSFPVCESFLSGVVNEEDIKDIKRIGILLSIVEFLNQYAEDICRIEFNITETSAEIKMNLHTKNDKNIGIPCRCIKNFKELFGRDLIIFCNV